MPSRGRSAAGAVAWRNVGAGGEALRAHRLRSALTTLGVVFGVGAVICMQAIGKGAEQRVLSELRRLGVHNLHVEARATEGEKQSGRGLLAEDANAALVALPAEVLGAAPERDHDLTVWIGPRSAEVRLAGVTPEYGRYLDLQVASGRFVSDLDTQSGAAVCVLSEPLLAVLLPAQPALGAVLRFGGQALCVVGVVRGVALGSERRPPVYLPLASVWRMLPRGRDPHAVQRIVVRLAGGADPGILARVLDAALLRRHGGTRDFSIVVPSELIRKEQRTQRIFQFVMGSIAGISLIVGGIGIMNIMFASVVERTAEIGVRRAVGARRRDILTQFLFEAAAIGALGGAIGVLLGILGAVAVARSAHWPILITPLSILLSAGTAIATGMLSGFVPARRAATVDAIVALHHE